MDLSNRTQAYQSIRVSMQSDVCYITLDRPESGNTIGPTLVTEFHHALDTHERDASVVVVQGSPEVFCMGADFHGIHRGMAAGDALRDHDPEPIYDLWRRLACGPFVSVAHVRGKVNAGGVGFVAACDLALSDARAVFSLSEMLFGLLPACVLPFLVRRTGLARANYLTLSTQPVAAAQAAQWGLVDAFDDNSEALLRKHLVRIRRLDKAAIVRHKNYAGVLDQSLATLKPSALKANIEAFSDPLSLRNIVRYAESGLFPWE